MRCYLTNPRDLIWKQSKGSIQVPRVWVLTPFRLEGRELHYMAESVARDRGSYERSDATSRRTV